jgi:hypothetical protein
MVGIRVLALAGVAAMTAALVYGFRSGDFSAEGSEILGLAWGQVTLIDLYVGLALFGGWVWFRETSRSTTLLWWLLLATLGNLAVALYLTLAAFRSNDPRQLLLGSRS